MVEHPDRVEWGTALQTIARALDLLLQEKAG